MFNQMNEKLINTKTEIVENVESYVHVYSALINQFSIKDIDFDQLTVVDIIDIRDTLFEIISEEDDEGNIRLDPEHPYSQLESIQIKIHQLESTPKQRVPSSFRFL